MAKLTFSSILRLFLILVLLSACAGLSYVAGKHSVIGRLRLAVRQAVWSLYDSPSAGKASIQELTRPPTDPVRLIFDTDIGNDIDDVLALALIHELVDRKEADLLAVSVSKDNPWGAPHVDLLNTFYGRPEIPIGVVRDGKTPEDGKYNRAVAEKMRDGRRVYPRRLESGRNAGEAVAVLRRVLAAQPDGSVVLVTVGFLTNAAHLIDSVPDDASPLTGLELVRSKVRLYVAMVGDFSSDPKPEYNAYTDFMATRIVLARWPTPLVAAGFEIGKAVLFPAESIDRDFAYVADHPVADAYRAFGRMPYDRPTWDLTAVLFAVRPDRGYFELSEPGRIRLEGYNVTHFDENPDGSHRYLKLSNGAVPRLREIFVQMVSSPPGQ